jgi:hypothetical protein
VVINRDTITRTIHCHLVEHWKEGVPHIATWENFEKKIRACFMAKGYKLLALCTFFLCAQGRLPFLKYVTNMMEA